MNDTPPRPRPLIVIDCETNGLDPDTHDVWEFAWWNLATGQRATVLPYLSDVPQFMANAAVDLTALRVNRFIERWTAVYRDDIGYGLQDTIDALLWFRDNVWPDVRNDTDDPNVNRAVIVAAQPKFDLPFVSKMLIKYDATADWAPNVSDRSEPWHYRAIDFSSYGAGVLGLDPANPDSASALAARVGVEIPAEQRHTAAGDVTLVGRTMLLFRWMNELAGGFDRDALDRVLADAPRGEEIDKLIG